MSTELGWSEIALRLLLTVIAGALIGFNRGEHGHPAGLRTTMLVCLAASLSMIQVNLLLGMSGKTPSSFAVMDLMRLPLGILSGMGFIGAGAILRKDSMVTGVTTAATLWFVTVMGLCFGGGQLILGLIALALGCAILWGLKAIERHWHQERKGTLTVISDKSGPDEMEIFQHVKNSGGKVSAWTKLSYPQKDGLRELACEVAWNVEPCNPQSPPFLKAILENPGAIQAEWKM